jgi:CheY-like chemotaxis protein
MSATILDPTSNHRPRALLLDDDAAAQGRLRGALERHGYQVRAAADGTAGLGLLLDELLHLDVLVVDLDLPGRDGWSLLRLIRGAGGERDLPVVVLASGAQPAVRAQLRALGADLVLDRSAGPAAAAAAIERVVRRGRRSRGPEAASFAIESLPALGQAQLAG